MTVIGLHMCTRGIKRKLEVKKEGERATKNRGATIEGPLNMILRCLSRVMTMVKSWISLLMLTNLWYFVPVSYVTRPWKRE